MLVHALRRLTAAIYDCPCFGCSNILPSAYGAMASRRSKSLGCEDRRKMRRVLNCESASTLKSLKAWYQSEDFGRKTVSPMFVDSRGNGLSVNSFGHIHHPFNLSTDWAWARFVEKLLDSSTVGLRTPLRIGCDVLITKPCAGRR